MYNKTVMANRLKKTLMIIIGTLILAISVEYFILPFSILSGGVAGIAVALEPFFHIDKTLFANCAVIVLLIVGWIILGKEFAINTVISSLCYPIFTTLFSRYPVVIEIDPLLAAIYAGLIGGLGIGLVIRTGASTGGMDIPPLVLNKLTGANISTLVMITDAITVLLGIIGYGLSAALVGLISVFTTGFAMSKVLELGRGSEAKSVQIISEKWEMMNENISKELDRGTTLLEATGGYTNEDKKVILCVVSKKQYAKLMEIIHEIDDKAFVITTDAVDMHGEGFTYSSPNI